METLMPIKKL